MRFCQLAILILLIQLARSFSDESAPCEPGFSEQRYAFTVTRKVLERGRILGKVRFESCSSVSHALYSPEDTRFRVLTDGTVVVKRQLVLHSGSVSFVLNAWDISGKKHSVPIFVWNERDQQVKSKNKNAVYSLTGNGSDSPPVGVFTIDRKTGWLMVTKALDREDIPKYIFAREYTLSIQASDMEGFGRSAVAKAVITVNDPKKTMSGVVGNSLTTHVLNTAQGIPAKDLTLTLSKHNAASGKWVQLSRSVTNEDGRCPAIQRGETLTAGTYQLRFDTEEYWKKMQQESFYPYVEIVFTIKDVKDKYHIPLLLSPYSYTTYRGS